AKLACDWPLVEKLSSEVAARAATGNFIEPFTLLGYSSDPALQLACAKAYIAHKVPIRPPHLWNGEIWRNPKIRIAYLGTGFHQHPTAYLTAELLKIHDRARFDVLGISLGPDDGSAIRRRLIRAFDEFHDVRSQDNRETAKLIHDLRIDILIDRSGYTSDARPEILAYRPAPIQVSYIGFPGTLGADFYDYVIADPIVLPSDQRRFYAEEIVHLPDCYLVNDSTRLADVETPSR